MPPRTQSKPPHPRPVVVIGLLGVTLDIGKKASRWTHWRPTVSLFQHDDFAISRLELIHPPRSLALAERVSRDIASASPESTINLHPLDMRDPWDLEEVYAALHDFAAAYTFDTDREDYLFHITTGTHVAQICTFLLTESRHFPGRLIQTSPPKRGTSEPGEYRIIDLDLSRYDRLASRFEREHEDAIATLKGGIETRNHAFNQLVDRIEHVAARTTDPILLMGPTGAGKSQMASRIYDLRKHRRVAEGPLVEVNCATLRGDAAMSTLFGHKKGAFTGANTDRPGLLRSADTGVLFLDEIGELGLDEQAMLLRALEEKRFLPLGADAEQSSDFQLIAGTNRDLAERVREGAFRDDLFARINLWTFALPALRDRAEDIEPNIDYELERYAQKRNQLVRFSTEAREAFLTFASSQDASWAGNFRDLNAALTRMATLAPGGRITEDIVDEEITRLRQTWSADPHDPAHATLTSFFTQAELEEIDLFDRTQLAAVIATCRNADSLSDAGRTLFAASRRRRSTTNDSDRVRKYLARFGLDFAQINE